MAWPSVRTSPAAAIVIAAILLQGCALSPVTPPGVEVENVQLTGLGALDQTVAVTLCATNPNASQLVFRNVRFRVAINGTPFAEGNSLSAIRLPPGSSTLVPLTVDTTIANLGPQLLVTLATGRVAYAVDGSVGLNGLPFSVPFQRSGSLSVLRTGLGLLQATDTPMATMCGPPIARPRPASNGAAETPG